MGLCRLYTDRGLCSVPGSRPARWVVPAFVHFRCGSGRRRRRLPWTGIHRGDGFLLRRRGCLWGAGFGVVGYFWRLRERWILMPLVGVGGGGYTFFVQGRPAEAPFDQATTGGGLPPRSFSTGGVLGNGAVVLQYFSTKGFMLGLQGGYEQALSSLREWSAAGISLQGGPSVQPQRFYVRLLLGGGVLSTPQN